MKTPIVYAIYKSNSYKTFVDMESAIKSNPETIVIFEKRNENDKWFDYPIFHNEKGEKIEHFGNFKIHGIIPFVPYFNYYNYLIIDTKGEVGFKYFHMSINGVVDFLVWVKETSHTSGWSEFNLNEMIKEQNTEIEKLKNRIVELENSLKNTK